MFKNYINSLTESIRESLTKYQRRVEKHNKKKHHHITVSEVVTIESATLGSFAAIGTAIGTIVPGVGNAVGTVVGLGSGAVTGTAILAGMETAHLVQNYKVKKAKNVVKFFGQYETEELINNIANRIINEREIALRNLADPEQEVSKITKFLTRQIMANIKSHYKSSNAISVKEMDEKIDFAISTINKIEGYDFLKRLETIDEYINRKHPYTLKGLAKNEKEKYLTIQAKKEILSVPRLKIS